MIEFITGLIIGFGAYFIGLDTGKNIRKEGLEQKLCELKQYEYCTKEELLKTIK